MIAISVFGQNKINLQTQVKGILPVANGGTGAVSPRIIAGTNISVTGTWPNQTISAIGTASAISATPSVNQTILSPGLQFNIFDVSFANFSALARTFPQEMPGGLQALYSFGATNTVSPMWIFGDRDGSDAPTTSALYVDEFITNNIDRPNSQQGTAIAAQARATGSGNFGFLAAATFNTQYNGSAHLHQAIQAWFATPRNQGSGNIDNTVGAHIANQGITGAITARGLEFESLATTPRYYQLYVPNGNNWLGSNNTWARRVTLGCPATEQVCTDDFTSLDAQPNGTMKYCTDCTISTPDSCTNVTTAAACTCTSGGTGAFAKRINGVWLCN